MQTSSAGVLEFESLRELLAGFVASPLGRAELEKIAPSSERARLDEALAEAEEATAYLRSAGKPQPAARGAAIRINFSGIPDLTATAHKLRIEGSTLDPKEILDLFGFLDRAADAKSILNAVTERFPRLGARGASIGDFRSLLRNLDGKILPDGTVADHASVALARLRRDIERQKKSIQDSLERFLRAHHEEGVLQEEFVTIRSERFVVPVIAGQRRRIEGVIHGASSSGHTLFVEPLETIDLNNELVRLTEEEMREVRRILREMTEALRGHSDSIRQTLATMGELELIFGKGRFATEFDCVRPRFGSRLILREARHPLLEDVLRRQRKKTVPISLQLDEDCRTLLISGPNTGGKTVALKTAGLLTLMAHSGLPVPCAEAEFPLFEQVLADIGDNQSIQESLSTFSAHISHIREMALDVTPDSLVLLDEIGAATDPEEGGALGVAVLDHFRASGAFTIASTHLLAIKIYGANTDKVLNGSMGFDEQTLEPTYELRLGLPGKSAGLDIAQRLGMPESILKRARESLSDRERDLDRLLAELQRRTQSLTTMEAEYKRREAELSAREAAKLKELEGRFAQAMAAFEVNAREALAKAAESRAAEKAMRRVSKARRELREEFQTEFLPAREEAPRPAIEEGARVRLRDIREPARVRRLIGEDRLEVEAGFMKMQVPVDDVVEVLPAAAAPPRSVSFRPAPRLNPLVQELNVIGRRSDEARDEVEKFLDSAVMATASRVRIIHGHGMGVLKKTIADLLSTNPHVEKFYPAPRSEGGAGATIVELKD